MTHLNMQNKVQRFVDALVPWLFSLLFAFPCLPLQIANSLFIVFAFFVLISFSFKTVTSIRQKITRNLLIALPFIPYLIELLLHSGNHIVAFEFQKKLLFFTAPIVVGMYLSMYPLKPLKTYMYIFTASLLALTIYSLTILVWQHILFSPESYENGAYILRNSFEKISHLHPTYYSLFASVSILWIISEYSNKSNLIKFLLIASGLILFFQELFVAAKMPLTALAISSLFLIYRITPNRKKLLGIYALLILCIIILPFVVPSLKNRVYEVRTFVGPPQNYPNTVNDRRVIFDCGISTFLHNIWVGVGAGNSQIILNQCYAEKDFKKANTVPYNAHNQFLTLGINYGIVPLLLLIVTLAIYFKRTFSNPFATALMISCILVMFTESILERQWGVYFYVLFFLLIMNTPQGTAAVKDI